MLRFDRAEKCDFSYTPQGGVRASARLTRVGVFEYLLSDGSLRRELRDPGEVFDGASLETLKGATVTVLHPTDSDGAPCMVSAENWKSLSVGHLADDVRGEGPYVAGTVHVQEAEAAARVLSQGEDRLSEVSLGYECDLDETPGVFDGQPYDGIQRRIRYNHVALGPPGWGRAGPNVRLRIDSAYCTDWQRGKIEMGKHRIDGIDYEIGTDSHIAAVDKALAAAKAAAETATGERDKAVARADAAEAKATPRAIAKAAAKRADLLAYARTQTKLGPKYRKDEGEDPAVEPADNAQIMRDLIAQMAPDLDVSGMDPAVLEGVLRGLMYAQKGPPALPEATADAEDDPEAENEDKKLPALDSVTSARPASRTDKADPGPRTEAAALAKMRERHANAWRAKR